MKRVTTLVAKSRNQKVTVTIRTEYPKAQYELVDVTSKHEDRVDAAHRLLTQDFRAKNIRIK